MDYSKGIGDDRGWIVAETEFDARYLGKTESIFALGNGYVGIRSAAEEAYPGMVRNTFVAGTFDRFSEREVTELPNAADAAELEIRINGHRFDLRQGGTDSYRKWLDLRRAALHRKVRWSSPGGGQVEFESERFVSLDDLHVWLNRVSLTAIDGTLDIQISSGINGQVTNSGTQHFDEGEKRIFDGQILMLDQTTIESGIDFVHTTAHRFFVDETEISLDLVPVIERRSVGASFHVEVPAGTTLTMVQYNTVATTNDGDVPLSLETLRETELSRCRTLLTTSAETLRSRHETRWNEYWDESDVTIGGDEWSQLAVRFALYHLRAMVPAHDSSCGIAAKGLTGEGYKGHSFWDTEIFILPYFIFAHPNIARSLLTYRHRTLPGARNKARENGYAGAMYPWESARTGDETTPVWGAVDIVTGTATKIWSGFIEQHITADVAWAVAKYYEATGDWEFMESAGLEILFDTATFWASRVESGGDRGLEIRDVMGVDEYKEHVDNNAFTNHMAAYNLRLAIDLHDQVSETQPELLTRLSSVVDERKLEAWRTSLRDLYLPAPNEVGIIPQDDTYLDKKQIDLSPYKNQKHVGSIFNDYNLEQINAIQVSKQADVMALLYVREEDFSLDVKRANWEFYEPRTLHDSSLSLSIHAVLAADMKDLPLAVELWNAASRIDLGPSMKSSDSGVHSASLGGIWQAAVMGFGGFRLLGDTIRIDPLLPDSWTSLSYRVHVRGTRLDVTISRDEIRILNAHKDVQLRLQIFGREYTLVDVLAVERP